MSEVTYSRSELTPSRRATYIDAHTRVLLHVDEFHDPEIRWSLCEDGQWRVTGRFQGDPLDSWLAANPRPASRAA